MPARIAARAGGIAAVLQAGRAPAYAQGTAIHWLRWNDFVPASDEVLRKEIIPAGEKALGIKLTLETITGNEIQSTHDVGDPIRNRTRSHEEVVKAHA